MPFALYPVHPDDWPLLGDDWVSISLTFVFFLFLGVPIAKDKEKLPSLSDAISEWKNRWKCLERELLSIIGYHLPAQTRSHFLTSIN